MKPRNKLHRRIVDLSNEILVISKKEKDWAFKECLEHKGFATKSRVVCLDCGETFSPTLVKRKKATCPHCNTNIDVKYSRCTTDKQTNYFAIANIVEEFQVIRNFELIAYYKKGQPVKYFLHEIIQYWIQPDLKTTMFGLAHNVQGFCDSWHGSMEIRIETGSYYGNKYEVYARKYHPKSVFKPEYLKIGINHKLQGLTFIEAVKLIPRVPRLETLIKAKQYGLLGLGQSHRLDTFWPSIKICLRNKYYVKDYSIYIDYLELLRHFNKDLRSSKYVCPKDLKKEHDKLVKKKRDIQKKRDDEKHRQEAEKANKSYQELKSKFFNLQFTNGTLVIVPLKSVQEFMEEGDALKHCVFTNKYYTRKDSLILSARIGNKPIETIEVNLEKLKIEQARGLKNDPTEYHIQIINLVKKNMRLIKECMDETTTSNKQHTSAAA